MALLTAALVVAVGPMLGWLVEQSAAWMGFTLRFSSLERGWFEVKVNNARFGLSGQSFLSGEASSVTFTLGLTGVSRVTAERARVVVVGAAPDVVGGLARWRTEHRGSATAEVSCAALTLEARDTAQEPSWLSFTGAAAPTAWGGALRGQRLSLFGAEVGPTTLGWSSTKNGVTLWLGERDAASASVRLEMPGTSPPSARLVAKNASLAPLAEPLSLPSARAAIVDAQVDLQFPKMGGIQGKATGALRGVSLMGGEWAGLVLGPSTNVSAQILGPPDGSRVAMHPLVVQSGGLSMQGSAELSKQGGARQLRGKLDGAVPCSMLARNAASNAVGGGVVGGLVGAVAGAAVGGNVSISVGFDVDTRSPRAGVVRPVIGVGCALQIP